MSRKNVRTNTGMSGARPVAIWVDEYLSLNNQPQPPQPNRHERRAAVRRESKQAAAAAEKARRDARRIEKQRERA